MLALYGSGILPAPPSYEQYLSLWLNRGRVLNLHAKAIADGFAIAMGAKPDRSFFEAIVDFEEQADEAQYQYEAERQQQEAVARYQRGGG